MTTNKRRYPHRGRRPRASLEVRKRCWQKFWLYTQYLRILMKKQIKIAAVEKFLSWCHSFWIRGKKKIEEVKTKRKWEFDEKMRLHIWLRPLFQKANAKRIMCPQRQGWPISKVNSAAWSPYINMERYILMHQPLSSAEDCTASNSARKEWCYLHSLYLKITEICAQEETVSKSGIWIFCHGRV